MGSIGSHLELSPPYPPDEELEKGKRFLQLHLSEVSVSMSGEFIVKIDSLIRLVSVALFQYLIKLNDIGSKRGFTLLDQLVQFNRALLK